MQRQAGLTGWRLHLSTQPIAAVNILSAEALTAGHGEPLPAQNNQSLDGDEGKRFVEKEPLIAVWDSRHNVHYYHQRDAVPSGEQQFDLYHPPEDLQDSFWQEFDANWQAPNGQYLPVIVMAGLNLYQSHDGRLRLYHFHSGSLIIEVEGRHIPLHEEQNARLLVAGLDRELGLCAAFNDAGQLHIFQQHIPVGMYELDLELGVDARLNLAMPDGLGRLLISDGSHVMLVDSAGRIQHELHTYYAVGPIAISPDGQTIALGDIDDNLIRVYDSTLRLTHQRHAIDLLMDARQVQLMASLPGRKAGISALDVSDTGKIVFALGGIVCNTTLTALDELPQPRPLL